MFGKKVKELEESRKEALEAVKNMRQSYAESKSADNRANRFLDTLAKRTEYAMIETVEFMRGS